MGSRKQQTKRSLGSVTYLLLLACLTACSKPSTQAPSVSASTDGFGRCCGQDDECTVSAESSRVDFTQRCEASGGAVDQWCPGDNKAVEVSGDRLSCSDAN